MYISINLQERIEYLKSIRFCKICGTHNANVELRSNLGFFMEKLKKQDSHLILNENTKTILKKIFDIIKKDGLIFDNFCNQYTTYCNMIKKRDDEISKYNKKYHRKIFCFLKKRVSNLSDSNVNIWGSSRQLLFGKIVVDEINNKYKTNLHPIFGCLLSPTGGITGPGNLFLFRNIVNFPMIMHTIVHDSTGYLFNFHNLGPSYCYLEHRCFLLPKSSSLNFIFRGITFWTDVMEGKI